MPRPCISHAQQQVAMRCKKGKVLHRTYTMDAGNISEGGLGASKPEEQVSSDALADGLQGDGG